MPNSTSPTSSNCSAASFANLTTTASLAYTDTGRYTPQGTYECYQVQTTYNTWNSVSGNPIAAAQLGFVAAGVAITNGGGAGKLDTGDTIVVTYNQAVNTATGPSGTDNVCTDTGTNTIRATFAAGRNSSALRPRAKCQQQTPNTTAAPHVRPARIVWTNAYIAQRDVSSADTLVSTAWPFSIEGLAAAIRSWSSADSRP